MSAAATAAGYLYASGRLLATPEQKRQRQAERAAEDLKRERQKSFQPRPKR